MAMKMWLFFLSSQGGGDTSIAGPGKTLNFPGIQEEDIGVGWYLRVSDRRLCECYPTLI